MADRFVFLAPRANLPHKARSFTTLPGIDDAPALLAQIAAPICPIAPAAADAPLALYGAGNLGRLRGTSSKPWDTTLRSRSTVTPIASRRSRTGRGTDIPA